MAELEPHIRRTPPDLKWLLNERASILGAIKSQDERRLKLEAKRQKLEHQLEIAQRDVQRKDVTIGALKTNLQALDAAISMVNCNANPECLGAVQAWAGRYGERGALTAFVKATLKGIAPEAVTMPVLLNMAAQNFGQTFKLPSERKSFRKSVRSALHALHLKGCVEPLHSGRGGEDGKWRWKSPISSLDELREQAQQVGKKYHHQDQKWH